MIKIAKLSFAHVHARGYANQILENPETELVAVWDEEEYAANRLLRNTTSHSIRIWTKSSPGITSTPLSLMP